MFPESFCAQPPDDSSGHRSSDTIQSIKTYARVLNDSTSPQLHRYLARLLLPALERLERDPSHPQAVGRGFIAFALTLLDLYVPDKPIDPYLAMISAARFWEDQSKLTVARLHVNRQAEASKTDTYVNPSVEVLEDRILALNQKLDSIRLPDIHRTPNLRILRSLFTEIYQIRDQIIGESHVAALVVDLEMNTPNAAAKETTFQGTIAGFLHRLRTTYTDHHDIIAPLIYAGELLRFGVRLVAQSLSASQTADTSLLQGLKAFSVFPPAQSNSMVRRVDIAPLVRPGETTPRSLDWIIAGVRSIVQDIQIGTPLSESIAEIEKRNGQLYVVWKQEREKAEREAVEAASLYRQAKHGHEALPDEEAQELEFRMLFPDYSEPSVDFGGAMTDSRESSSTRIQLSPEQRRTICDLHLLAFSSSANDRPSSSAEATSLSLLREIVNNPDANQNIDAQSLCYRTNLTAQHLAALHGPTASKVTFNFYRDPNVPEARKVVEVMSAFVERIEQLLSEWPDQMVLKNLREKAESILALEIQCPVARILAAVEQLLLQIEDWERYAHRGNSLKAQQQALVGLVVEWRRLELSFWAQLMDSEIEAYTSTVSVWWFRLYETVIHGTISAAQMDAEEAVIQHVESLCPLLDQYLSNSTVGEFGPRLVLLGSFAQLAGSMASSRDSNPIKNALRTVSTVIRCIHDYWEQFNSGVEDHLSSERKKLERTVKDIIKLASWKDVNVYALKASAEKSHRQLHKCIRKLRETLQQQVEPHLILGKVASAESDNTTVPTTRVTAPYPTDIVSPSYARLVELVSTRIAPFAHWDVSLKVDELSVDLISTVQSFSTAVTHAEKDGGSRQKSLKALATRKRKVFADFLKDFKEVGLPQNVRSDILAQQHSRSWLMQQSSPLVCAQSLPAAFDVLSRVENYHQRLAHRLPVLRNSTANHHVDIATRDLQRGILFVESALAISLNSRTTYVWFTQ